MTKHRLFSLVKHYSRLLTGTASGFDSSALLSSVNALGIRFYLASKPLAVNSTLPIVFPGTLVLGAVPVQQSGVTLEGGEFTASAALCCWNISKERR